MTFRFPSFIFRHDIKKKKKTNESENENEKIKNENDIYPQPLTVF